VNNDWKLEEAWGLYLVGFPYRIIAMLLAYLTAFKQGSHFERCGVDGLGSELQCRGISLHGQWGAQGIV
jgi:hypothetical protein